MYYQHYFKSLTACLLYISVNETLCMQFIKNIFTLKQGSGKLFNFTDAIRNRYLNILLF